MWVSASLWASRPLCGSWTSPTHSPLPNGLFTSSTHHPWEPRVNPTRTSMGTPYILVHGSLAPHHYLASLAIFLFFFPPRSLCVGHLGFLYLSLVGTMNTSPPLPHTIMSSDTTCWGDKYHGELSRVINMTYKNTL